MHVFPRSWYHLIYLFISVSYDVKVQRWTATAAPAFSHLQHILHTCKWFTFTLKSPSVAFNLPIVSPVKEVKVWLLQLPWVLNGLACAHAARSAMLKWLWGGCLVFVFQTGFAPSPLPPPPLSLPTSILLFLCVVSVRVFKCSVFQGAHT